jgi:hypothetical protein
VTARNECAEFRGCLFESRGVTFSADIITGGAISIEGNTISSGMHYGSHLKSYGGAVFLEASRIGSPAFAPPIAARRRFGSTRLSNNQISIIAPSLTVR